MSTTEIKWKPGSPGRKPAWTKGLSNKRILEEWQRRNAGETDQKSVFHTSDASDSFPGNSSNVQEIPSPTAKEVEKDPTSPDEKPGDDWLPNPFKVRDAKGNPIASEFLPEIDPTPKEIPPWEDESKIAALTPITGIASAFVLDLACQKLGKQPINAEAFRKAKIPSLTAQVVLVWYPDAGNLDPRHALTGQLVMAMAGLVMMQPPIEASPDEKARPKEQEQAQPPRGPSPTYAADNRPSPPTPKSESVYSEPEL